MAELRAALVHGPGSAIAAAFTVLVIVLTSGSQAGAAVTGRTSTTPDGASEDHSRARGYRFTRVERCFLKRINRRRDRAGLRRLRWDRQLGYVARRHAGRMARTAGVSHDPRLTRKVTRWRSLGQNSGMGKRCRGLFRAFWRSSGHRSNILGRWRFVGVGVRRSNKRLYVQQIFEYRSNPGNIYGHP